MKANKQMNPMIKQTLLRLCVCFLLSFFSFTGWGQNTSISRWEKTANNPEVHDGDRMMALCELIDFYRNRDKEKTLKLMDKAIFLAKRSENPRYRGYVYGYRTLVYISRNELQQAEVFQDSCLYFADISGNEKLLSFAWYLKGRLLGIAGKTKEALKVQLKALHYIKGKGYWKEEAQIYYRLYGVYSEWEDLDNEDKYAFLALDAAQKSHDPNRICEALQAVSICFEYRYLKTNNIRLRDSALVTGKRAIAVYLQNEPRMTSLELIAIPAINIADVYDRHFPPSPAITDSILRYTQLARKYAFLAGNLSVQVASYGILGEDAKRRGDYKQAETYFLMGVSIVESDENKDYYLLASLHQGLSELAEFDNDYKKALSYYKLFKDDHAKIYNSEQAAAGKELEGRYQAREKEQQINFLTESEQQHRRQKYLYIGIAVALLLGLLFMFRSYHFRLRYSIQREQLHEQEKEEVRLLARIKEEEALLLESEKQKAELRERLQAEETARLKAEQLVMQARADILQKEVLAGNLHVEQKNKVLKDLKTRLEEDPDRDAKTELNRLISQQSHLDSDFEEFKTDLKEIHPDFYHRLQEKAGNKLTTLDLKYCAYIFLKRSTKEMAVLLSVEPKSIRMSKYRIKQKLALGREEELEDWIRSIV